MAVASFPQEIDESKGGTGDDVGLARLELVGLAADEPVDGGVLGLGHRRDRGDLPRRRRELAAPGGPRSRADPGRAVRRRRDRRGGISPPAADPALGPLWRGRATPLKLTVRAGPRSSGGGPARSVAPRRRSTVPATTAESAKLRRY